MPRTENQIEAIRSAVIYDQQRRYPDCDISVAVRKTPALDGEPDVIISRSPKSAD